MTVALADESTVPVRPLSFRELLDIPFAVVANNIGRLSAAAFAAILWAEAFVILAVLIGDTAAGQRMSEDTTQLVMLAVTVAGAWFVCSATRGVGTVLALADVRREKVSVRAALGQLAGRAGALATATLVALAQGVGAILLAVPIVTSPLAVWLLLHVRTGSFLVLPLIMSEPAPWRPAVDRSKYLVNGARWRIAGAWMALRVLLLLFVPPILVARSLLSEVSGTERWASVVLTSTAFLVAAALLGVLDGVQRVVSGVDRRCRREAIDIRLPA